VTGKWRWVPAKPAPRPKPKPAPKPAPRPAPRPPATYTVRHGDTLSGIAARFHIAGGWRHLYALNRAKIGSNPNVIHVGLVLRLA
jgi:nucleoid-associated protein YgaU